MTIGRKLIKLEVVDSTNNYAAKLIKSGEIEPGTVILADNQTAGRGQRMAEWRSNPGENLTFSCYVEKVNLSVQRQFVLSQVVALILVEFFNKLGLEAEVKWPNDILVDRKKIAGVLIENQLKGADISSSIIGVGINVNQSNFDGMRATSIYQATGKYKNIQELMFAFISSFNQSFERLISQPSSLKEQYMAVLYGTQETIALQDEDGKFQSKIIDILESGKVVITRNNQPKEYDLKEVTFNY